MEHHTHIYIYICTCVYVCVRVSVYIWKKEEDGELEKSNGKERRTRRNDLRACRRDHPII